MSTFPPGQITPLGASMLMDGIDAHVWFTSFDGNSRYYLDGPLSPLAPGVPGQDGMILKSHKGLLTGSSFKHLDLQAAVQDGVTWTDTVYDAGKIVLQLEAHARTPQGVQAVVDEWIGAWNPRQLHTLEHIITTPGGGYWSAQVRLDQVWQNEIKQSPRRYFYMPLTHICRIDNAFWTSIASMSTFGLSYETFGDDFGAPNPSGLSGDWDQMYSAGHTMIEFVADDGTVQIKDNGNSTQSVVNLYTATQTTTDFQVISITLTSAQFSSEGFTFAAPFGGASSGQAQNHIWGRLDNAGNGIRCSFNLTTVHISRFVAGVETVMWIEPLIIPPLPGETWTLVCGANLDEPRSYSVYRSGLKITPTVNEIGANSLVGSSYRGTGFGLRTAGGVFGFGEAIPMYVAAFNASDQTADTQSGHVQLSNPGTQDGYPELLVTGPGTINFGDGPNSSTMVSFGPLLDGQRALITTLPRLRGVVDLTVGTATQAIPQTILEQLVALVFNGNTPPLINWLESQLGALPPQTTNLYSLLNGRYKTPLPGVAIPSMATTQRIPVSITNGTLASSIIARLVPQRVAPA